MGRTDSTLWFKRNVVKPEAVLQISPSTCKWCRDRSGGSSIADEVKGKLVLDMMKMVLVVTLFAFPLVSVGGRGVGLEMGGVFDGPRGRWNIISIGYCWGLSGRVGGSRYHTGSPSVKSYRLQVAKTDLLKIPDGRKRKRKRERIMLIGNEPHCFPGN